MNVDEITTTIFNSQTVSKKKKFDKPEYNRLKQIEKYNQAVIEAQSEYLQLSDEKKILLFNEFICKFPYLTRDLIKYYFKQELSELLKLN